MSRSQRPHSKSDDAVDGVADAIDYALFNGHTRSDHRVAYSIYVRNHPSRKIVVQLKRDSWPVVSYGASLGTLVKLLRHRAVIELASSPRQVLRIDYNIIASVTNGEILHDIT